LQTFSIDIFAHFKSGIPSPSDFRQVFFLFKTISTGIRFLYYYAWQVRSCTSIFSKAQHVGQPFMPDPAVHLFRIARPSIFWIILRRNGLCFLRQTRMETS